jgi:hypothetical protein
VAADDVQKKSGGIVTADEIIQVPAIVKRSTSDFYTSGTSTLRQPNRQGLGLMPQIAGSIVSCQSAVGQNPNPNLIDTTTLLAQPGELSSGQIIR